MKNSNVTENTKQAKSPKILKNLLPIQRAETDESPISNLAPSRVFIFPKNRIWIGLTFTIIGYLFFLLGARPGLFGLDRSKVIGFVQIAVFLVGLAIITFSSYLTLVSFWLKGTASLLADFGLRFISTGYIICVFAGMADVFGFGSHKLPSVFFGPLQAYGVEIGMVVIAIGFLMLIRFDRH
ncbi:MAG: hypothetical protein ABIG43_01620 [Chloroflexota bacterium]